MTGLHLGCCVSAHGFGHAARTAAVVQALAELGPVHCTVASQVPEWFFNSSLPCPYRLHPLQTDVGLVQQSALHADLPATLRALAGFYPLRQEQVARLAELFAGCDLVLCDIAPIGIAAARLAGVPSVLLENFTWDWLYAGYLDDFPQLRPFIALLRDLFGQAGHHIQAIPVCAPGSCDLLAGPIARRVRCDRATLRDRLGVREGQRLVLISPGGTGLAGTSLRLPAAGDDTLFLIAGQSGETGAQENIRFLRQDSGLDHPDLVAACDAVIGKVGYSTLAEVYRARVPFAYIPRRGFRESGPLVRFIREEMAGLELSEEDLADGSWCELLATLFALAPPPLRLPDGARQCAAFLAALAGAQRCCD